MKVGLFIPCYMDQFYPQAAIATYKLLLKLGCDVEYPEGQTCCGQPLANAGNEAASRGSYLHFVSMFEKYDYIVAPSGSCVYHVRHHFNTLEQTDAVKKVRAQTLDLTEFLLDVLQISSLPAKYPHKVGLHQSCHGLRGLHLATSSELVNKPAASKLHELLSMVEGLTLVELDRKDECCGFGGTFSVKEPAISVKMGKDRIRDHFSKGAEVITAGDMSCLMHLEGIISRQNIPIKVIHIAEILNSDEI